MDIGVRIVKSTRQFLEDSDHSIELVDKNFVGSFAIVADSMSTILDLQENVGDSIRMVPNFAISR
jgi:hypothetical protein